MQEAPSTDFGALLRESFEVSTKSDNLVPLLVDALVVVTLGVCTLGILFPPLTHGYTAMCLRAARGEAVEVGESFRGMSRFGPAFVLGLLLLALALVTSIIPVIGTFVGVCVGWWAWCIHVDRPEMSSLDALKASFDLARNRVVETLVIAAIGLGLHTLFAATFIGLVLSVTFSGVLTAVAYRRITA